MGEVPTATPPPNLTGYHTRSPLTVDQAPRLHAAGLTHLHPIIPPGATLSAKSKITPDKVGKIPGLLNQQGEWHGFDWVPAEFTAKDYARWARWPKAHQIGLGMQAGRGFFAVDIDVTDPVLADVAFKAITETLGPAPVRIGRYPKLLLLYREAPGVTTTGRQVRFVGADGTKHLIEVLGRGQQFVLGGIHPKTGAPYLWYTPTDQSVTEQVTVADPFDVDVALQWAADALAMFDCTVTDEHSSAGGDRNRAVDQSALSAVDLDLVERAVRSIPNDYPDRDSYIRMGCAIKAAFAEDEPRGRALFHEWAATWEGGNDPDVVDADWRRMKPPFEVGAGWILDTAAAGSDDVRASVAAVEFAGADLPPLEEGETVREVKPKAKTKRTRGRGKVGGYLPENIWESYVYVESLERFVDLGTKVMLSKSQFKDRHSNIGDPTSRDNAASRYLADMERRRIVARTTYRPGEGPLCIEDRESAVNIWRPGPYFEDNWASADVTDADIAEYLALAQHVLPNKDERELFLDWLAYQLQQPGTKCNWHIILGSGAHGIGKDTLLEPVVRGLGERNCPVISPSDLQGQWSDWLHSASLVRIEEMNSFSRREVMDRIKPYLAAPPAELRVNIKGVPQFKTPNIINLIFFTNHLDAMAIEENDRRLTVLWSDAQPWPEDRFARLYQWLHDRGGDRLVCAWLAKRDLAAFSARGRARMTDAKAQMVEAGKGVVEAVLADQVERRVGCFARDLVFSSEVAAQLNADPAITGVTPTRVGVALRRMGAVALGQIRADGGGRERVWALARADMYRGLDPEELRKVVTRAVEREAERGLDAAGVG